MFLALVVSTLSQDFMLPTGSLVLGGMLQWKQIVCLVYVQSLGDL